MANQILLFQIATGNLRLRGSRDKEREREVLGVRQCTNTVHVQVSHCNTPPSTKTYSFPISHTDSDPLLASVLQVEGLAFFPIAVVVQHPHQVHEGEPRPKGWVSIPDDHPYLQPEKTIEVKGDTVAERVKARRATVNYASDCTPAYLAHVATASRDLATDHKTPRYYREAQKSPDAVHWNKAMEEEIKSIQDMGCYTLIPLADVPDDANLIGYTWVYKIKQNGDGTISRYKARICVDGSKQKYGIDYLDTFAPVANATTIRMQLAMAIHMGYHLRQFDIKLAFVSSKIDQPVYMRAPVGSKTPPGFAWLLKKSLYGLRQAPRLFNKHLDGELKKQGWIP